MTNPPQAINQLPDGETIRLAHGFVGEAVIKLDGLKAGLPLSAGTFSIPPGGAIPMHRFGGHTLVVFVHKGQGRITVGERSATVVPGVTASVARLTWFGLRNTGTGTLQLIWTAAPAGLEEFYREASKIAAVQELAAVAQRHGIELQGGGVTSPEPAGAAAPGAEHPERRRRRRGGRGRGRGSREQGAKPAEPRPSAPSIGELTPDEEEPVSAMPPIVGETSPEPEASAAPGTTPPQRSRPPGSRAPRPRRGRSRRPASQPSAKPSGQTSDQPVASPPPATSAPSPRSGTGTGARRGGRQGRGRRGRVREVYMGGRWIQVTGDGPVIDLGKDRAEQTRRGRDDDDPSGPLSVAL